VRQKKDSKYAADSIMEDRVWISRGGGRVTIGEQVGEGGGWRRKRRMVVH